MTLFWLGVAVGCTGTLLAILAGLVLDGWRLNAQGRAGLGKTGHWR